jgi:membrane-associated progesterone receptor component
VQASNLDTAHTTQLTPVRVVLVRHSIRAAFTLHFAASYAAVYLPPRSSNRDPFPPSPTARTATALAMSTELTAAQLRAYDGSDPPKPIYLAVRGKVYDVTSGRSFYGPGGSYAMFAGREAARALGKMSKDEADISGDLSGLSDKELGVLADWETKFQAKYPVVARLTNA